MALITTLLTSGKKADLYGQAVRYDISTSDLVALGAFTTGKIQLDVIPAGAVMQVGRVKHSQAVVGPSISAATVRVVTAASTDTTSIVNSFGSAALDIFQAVSDTAMTTFGTTTVTPVSEAFGGTSVLQASFVFTGANASVITAGALSVWVKWFYLK